MQLTATCPTSSAADIPSPRSATSKLTSTRAKGDASFSPVADCVAPFRSPFIIAFSASFVLSSLFWRISFFLQWFRENITGCLGVGLLEYMINPLQHGPDSWNGSL